MLKNIEILGSKFNIMLHEFDETVSNIIREKGIYSRNDLLVMKDVLKEGDTFIDVGANIGWHTLFGSTLVGSTGQVISFEPASDNFNLLEQNVKTNEFNNVLLSKYALSNKVHTSEIALSSVNYGDNVVCARAGTEELLFNWYGNKPSAGFDPQNIRREDIHCTSLDNFIESNNIDASKIKLIKMDIQGCEALALEGMQEFIKTHKPYFILEFSPRHLKICNSSPFDILSFIDKNNYILFHLREQFDIPVTDILYRAKPSEIVEATERLFTSDSFNGFDLFLAPVQ